MEAPVRSDGTNGKGQFTSSTESARSARNLQRALGGDDVQGKPVRSPSSLSGGDMIGLGRVLSSRRASEIIARDVPLRPDPRAYLRALMI